MFGSEQRVVKKNVFLRFLYCLIGEFRFPLRLRAYYLAKAVSYNFTPQRIWDAGCGEGHSSFFLGRRFPQSHILGTDVSSKAIKHCNNILEGIPLNNLRFRCLDLEDEDLEFSQQFDLIICFEVLEHIENYERAIRNMARHLRKDGFLFIHTPAIGRFQSNKYGLRRYFREDLASTHEKGQFHVRAGFSLTKLRNALTNAGFNTIDVQYTFGKLSMLAHTFYEVTRSRSRIWQLASLPLLMMLGWFDAQKCHTEGGGLFIEAQ